jgi:hypothetical protein
MTRYNFIIWLLLVCIFHSCNGQSMGIDEIIKKYSTEDFNVLKNKSVYFRSKGNSRTSSIYFVNIFKGKCSPYVVEYDEEAKKIIEIKNHLVISSCEKDYLSNSEIEQAILKFKKYNFYLIQVDEMGNVYINPDSQDLPTILRKAPNSNPKDIDKYKIYQDNWYIKK